MGLSSRFSSRVKLEEVVYLFLSQEWFSLPSYLHGTVLVAIMVVKCHHHLEGALCDTFLGWLFFDNFPVINEFLKQT